MSKSNVAMIAIEEKYLQDQEFATIHDFICFIHLFYTKVYSKKRPSNVLGCYQKAEKFWIQYK